MKADYICLFIGDGKSTETAFRPAIADVMTGNLKAFPDWTIPSGVPVDANGKPIFPSCTVRVGDNANASLLIGNPNITLVSLV